MRDSACVEMMTTLHGNTPSFWRRAEGCVPQDAQVLPPKTSHGVPFHLSDHYEIAPPPAATVSPPIFTTTNDTRLVEQEARVERLESRMRQIRLEDGSLTWDDRDGIPAASLPAKFRMPDIERYSGIGCPKIRLRLYSTVMRAHKIDDAQLVAIFPMLLSGVGQRWFASVEPSKVRTWEDVSHEFLIQFAFSTDIDVSRRELEATRKRSDESISSFVSHWKARVASMIDWPKEQDQIDMVLRNLQPRFARRLVGIPFQDLKSLIHAAFNVEEVIARGLWTDTTLFLDNKGKRPIGSSSRSEEYQPVYVQQPYIAQTSMQLRPPHPRATTHPPPRAFEKLKDAGLNVPLAPRPLPHPIPSYFRSHEQCSFHQTQGHATDYCSTLRNTLQDLIDAGLVNLSGPSVTVTPLPTHSTHTVPLLLVFSGLIWMLMVLTVVWYFEISRVEDLVQSTWITMREWLDCLMILLRQRGYHGASRFEPLHMTSESWDD
ncbi:hypothetical protein CK203_092506 [Vitis vinifera]|uniref:Retrotransposon gag domain-containing protein n=1 Tax=Vitis vinifera TaxID=29760 RepID=A0A438DHR0_VITVI|nr:hypothetical protein CK203_092506 [Vitis vinifera]